MYFDIDSALALLPTDEQREGHSFYGAAALIVRGHSQAKQRVILFLTIFVINGFCSESAYKPCIIIACNNAPINCNALVH